MVFMDVLDKKPDERVGVKLTRENTEALKKAQESMLARCSVRVSMNTLANAAVKLGLPGLDVLNHDHVQS